MKMRLRRHLVVVFVAFSITLLVAILVPLGLATADSHLAGYVEQRLADTRSVVRSLAGKPRHERVGVIRYRYPTGGFSAGWLLETTGLPAGPPTDQNAFPSAPGDEVARARGGPDAHHIGLSPIGKRLFVAMPIIVEDRLDGILWMSSSLAPVSRLNSRSWSGIAMAGFGGILFAGIAASLVARRISQRLEGVAAGAERFAAGRLDSPIVCSGSDEIAELAGTLNEMATRIAQLIERERDFINAAAHQLRTPLTALTLRLDRLHRIAVDSAEAGEEIAAARTESRRLTRLTDRLLDLSRASETDAAEAVPVDEAIDTACRRVAPLAAEGSVRLAVVRRAPGLVVRAPWGALDDLLLNLLDNAVKYSDRGGSVEVTVSASNGHARLVVADRGPGIPAAVRSRAFEPFERFGDRPGHGLGLSICARLCAESAASIALRDRADGPGTSVVVDWPLAKTD